MNERKKDRQNKRKEKKRKERKKRENKRKGRKEKAARKKVSKKERTREMHAKETSKTIFISIICISEQYSSMLACFQNNVLHCFLAIRFKVTDSLSAEKRIQVLIP